MGHKNINISLTLMLFQKFNKKYRIEPSLQKHVSK